MNSYHMKPEYINPEIEIVFVLSGQAIMLTSGGIDDMTFGDDYVGDSLFE